MTEAVPARPVGLPLAFIALSYPVFLAYSYLVGQTEDGLPFLDPFNLGLDLFWLAVLVWIGWMVVRRSPSARTVLLVVACIGALFSLLDAFDGDRVALFAASVAEALLLFAAYLTTPKAGSAP